MSKVIALAGNPNCGKTTLFNKLTKSNQHIGNWPGVTVEHKTGKYYLDKEVEIIDLPGIYSLSPLSIDELVSRNFLLDHNVDLIIDVVDATNLERNLYLTTHLLALDCRIVIALNMMDEAQALGIKIDVKELEKQFNCDVIEISAAKNQNLNKLMEIALNDSKPRHRHVDFDVDTEQILDTISNEFDKYMPQKNKHWYELKLLEMDSKAIESMNISENDMIRLKGINESYCLAYGDRADVVIATQRYDIVEKITQEVLVQEAVQKESISDKIDKYVTSKWLGIPIFIAVMFLMFFVSIQSLGAWTVTGMEWLVDQLKQAVFNLMDTHVQAWLVSLVVDGIISGVGGIIVYVPQIMILFGFISIFEACGYMSRVAFLLDKVFNAIGLSGKSLIPMIVGCGCSVPGIMCARTIKNTDERNSTIMLVPFMPCSAKLVIFSYFTTALFNGNALIATSLYFISIVAIALGGLFLKFVRKISKAKEDDTFVMELPPYRVPSAKNVLKEMWEKGKSFIIKAGTVIFIASIVLWFLQTFSFKFQMVEAQDSMLAGIGKAISWFFIPLGFGNWEYAVATLTGIAAKETVIVTLNILSAPVLSKSAIYSFMIFNLLCFPCISAISASFKELGQAKYGFLGLLFQLVTAYLVSLVFYQLSRLLELNSIVFWTVLVVIFVVLIMLLIIKYLLKNKKQGKCIACGGNCSSCAACKDEEIKKKNEKI